MTLRGALTLAVLGRIASGCAAAPVDAQPPPLAESTRLCVGDAMPARACRSPREVERWLEADRLEVLGRRETGGAQGAVTLTLRAGAGVFDAKWRTASSATADNNPLGELGAHRVQQLLFDPSDYVVPPAVSHCFGRAEHARWPDLAAPLEGTGCGLGYLSYWLTGAVGLGEARRDGLLGAPTGDPWRADPGLYDPARFDEESPAYRRNVAHLNLLAFLINNGDAHTAQFVVYPRPLHVFLVDHSVAFSVPARPSMRGRQSLAELVVPAIPADTARRLLALEPADVMQLMRLGEHVRTGDAWRRVPPGPLLSEGRERVRSEGDRIQVGLSQEDARGVVERLLIAQRALRVGTLRTFD